MVKKLIKVLYKMGEFLIIGQGSQSIQLLRQLFSLNVSVDKIKVITVDEKSNLSFIEFLTYYEIKYVICNKNNFIDESYTIIDNFNPKIVISFSNPFILSDKILSTKTKFINFHPGILPNYKGNLSTIHSMINKEKFVGGTWHYIDSGIDTGNIIKLFKIPIKNFNAFTLNHKIFSIGINCLEDVIEKVKNNYDGRPQKKIGKYYTKKFPNINDFDLEMQNKLSYFPPKFL